MRNLEDSLDENNLPRTFKGIWIPKEIWLRKELSFFEKCLWAEIDSLDDEKLGCTASNSYLCNIFDVQERTLQNALSKLKNLGMIAQEHFNGRIRTLRSGVKVNLCTSDPQPIAGANSYTSGMKKSAPLPTPLYKEERIVERIDSLVPPSVGTTKRLPSKESLEIAQELLKKVLEIHPKFKQPKIENWAEELDKAIRIDSRAPNELLEAISFAFSDPFWSTTLQSAEGLRRNFDKIFQKMNAGNTKPGWISKNRAVAHDCGQQLRAAQLPIAKSFHVSDRELLRIDTNESISLELESQIFEMQMIKLFNLRKYD